MLTLMNDMPTADQAWHDAYITACHGETVSPRGMKTREVLHATHMINMRYPVVTNEVRHLNYRFMAAEALWILLGQSRLDELLPYNSKMADFSDDGVVLAGAYGPRIAYQLNYVVETIIRDPDTRQATLVIWAPNPKPSKDIPCTVAIDFKLRNNRLDVHVFMRSSDVWLGLPYDIFSFSCIGYMVTACLRPAYPDLEPGTLWITAASSHVYTKDIVGIDPPQTAPPPAPDLLWSSETGLINYLARLRQARLGDPLRWWTT